MKVPPPPLPFDNHRVEFSVSLQSSITFLNLCPFIPKYIKQSESSLTGKREGIEIMPVYFLRVCTLSVRINVHWLKIGIVTAARAELVLTIGGVNVTPRETPANRRTP